MLRRMERDFLKNCEEHPQLCEGSGGIEGAQGARVRGEASTRWLNCEDGQEGDKAKKSWTYSVGKMIKGGERTNLA